MPLPYTAGPHAALRLGDVVDRDCNAVDSGHQLTNHDVHTMHENASLARVGSTKIRSLSSTLDVAPTSANCSSLSSKDVNSAVADRRCSRTVGGGSASGCLLHVAREQLRCCVCARCGLLFVRILAGY